MQADSITEDLAEPRGVLLAILATPPRTTSGSHTRTRVRAAAAFLGFKASHIVNLLDAPTRDVTEISAIGVGIDVWLHSRPPISAALDNCDGVLVAWGVTAPVGPARHHHSAQIRWVIDEAETRGLRLWSVGDVPRHPSRWQRLTSREHPGVEFAEALAASLQVFDVGRGLGH